MASIYLSVKLNLADLSPRVTKRVFNGGQYDIKQQAVPLGFYRSIVLIVFSHFYS